MNDDEPAKLNYVEEDDAEKVLEELTALAQQGDIETLAVRLYLKDGTYRDIVTGYKTEEERLTMLADLRRRINTETN